MIVTLAARVPVLARVPTHMRRRACLSMRMGRLESQERLARTRTRLQIWVNGCQRSPVGNVAATENLSWVRTPR
eukprot:12860643-Alexandrium_andersonii.AAC.1